MIRNTMRDHQHRHHHRNLHFVSINIINMNIINIIIGLCLFTHSFLRFPSSPTTMSTYSDHKEGGDPSDLDDDEPIIAQSDDSAGSAPGASGSQPLSQRSADKSNEWWSKYQQYMFTWVDKLLWDLRDDANAKLTTLRRHSEDFKEEFLNNLLLSWRENVDSPVLRCFGFLQFQRQMAWTPHVYNRLKEHFFMVRFDFHELARNGRIKEEDFSDLSTFKKMGEYWGGSEKILPLPIIGYCFFFKGNRHIVSAMERIADNGAVIERLHTEIETVKRDQVLSYAWRQGYEPTFDSHSFPTSPAAMSFSKASFLRPNWGPQSGETQILMAPGGTQFEMPAAPVVRDCRSGKRGRQCASQPLQNRGAEFSVASGTYQELQRRLSLALQGTPAKTSTLRAPPSKAASTNAPTYVWRNAPPHTPAFQPLDDVLMRNGLPADSLIRQSVADSLIRQSQPPFIHAVGKVAPESKYKAPPRAFSGKAAGKVASKAVYKTPPKAPTGKALYRPEDALHKSPPLKLPPPASEPLSLKSPPPAPASPASTHSSMPELM